MTRTSNLKTFATLFFLCVLFAALSAGAVTAPLVPTDECVEVDHSPTEPIGTSPSKAIFFFTVPTEFGGWDVEVDVDGASGQVEGVAIIEEDGLGVVQVPLNTFGSHEVVAAMMSFGGELVDIELLPEGFEVDANEPTCDPASLTRAEPASAPTTTTSTTAVPASTTAPTPSTTSAPTTTTAVATTDASGSTPWGWIGIGIGLPLILFGVWLLAGAGRNCEPLRREWHRLQTQYDNIRQGFDAAVAYLEEKRAARAEVEAEVAEIQRVGRMGGILEGDLRFKVIPEGKVTEAGFDQVLGTASQRLDGARETEAPAQESVEKWKIQLEEAAVKAEVARRAYEACIGEAVAGLTPPADTGPAKSEPLTSGSTVSDGPVEVVPTPTVSGCPEGSREARPLTAPRSFRIYVDFAVIVEVEEGTERHIETGEDLAVNLGQLGLDLGAIGSLLGGRGAGINVASGVTGLGAGRFVKGGAGVARGSIEGVLAVKGNLGTDAFPIPVPTSPEEVLVGVLQVTAQLGSVVAGKVTEWMRMNQIYRVRSTLFFQEVSVQPVEIWECEAGHWLCVEKVLQYEVSGLERQQGPAELFRIESEVSSHRFETHINGLSARAKRSIESSAKSLVEFEQANQPGPCS